MAKGCSLRSLEDWGRLRYEIENIRRSFLHEDRTCRFILQDCFNRGHHTYLFDILNCKSKLIKIL